MKVSRLLLLFLFVCLSKIVTAQDCYTIWSDEECVQKSVYLEFRNCSYVYLDSSFLVGRVPHCGDYTIERQPEELYCFEIYHSETKKLLSTLKLRNDSIWLNEYYPTGQLKRETVELYPLGKSFVSKTSKAYYVDGTLRYMNQSETMNFKPKKTYYPDGSLMSEGLYFNHYTPTGDYYEYFPNGQVSAHIVYAEPDTTESGYQQSNIVSQSYFYANGDTLDFNANSLARLSWELEPYRAPAVGFSKEGYVRHYELEDHPAYAYDMSFLKSYILKELEIDGNEWCTTGAAGIRLHIETDGSFKYEVGFPGDYIRNQIEAILEDIGTWPPGVINGTAYPIYVDTYLVIEPK
ncbi:MAG: hypothetical protein ACFHU9_00330 [Fluviicola sp.]